MEKIPDSLKAVLVAPEKFLLLIDFDGTLVEIVDDPSIVLVPGTLRQDLVHLKNAGLSFVIVTGRPVSAIDGFMGCEKLPVLGGHGIELRLDPSQPTQFLAEPVDEALRRALCGKGQQFGCYVEDKIYSLSLHARDPAVYDALEKELSDTLCANNLSCRMRRIGRTFEILQTHLNKGAGIIAHLLSRKEFANKKIIYIGDDVENDESLHVVTEKGGRLISVGGPNIEPGKADFSGPEALRTFISTLAGAVSGAVNKSVASG